MATAEVGDAARRSTRYTGFDAVRIVAALAVVLTHSFQLTGYSDRRPGIAIGRYDIGLGTLGVSVFFITSGLLVTQSWQRTGGVGAFARNRFARIWPALVVLVLATVFVLGPLVTTVSTRSYFTDRLTLEYLVKNCTLFLGFEGRLPGVFTGQPATAVNASLWTLPQEVYAYVLLAACGVLGLLRRWWGGALVFLACLLVWRFRVYAGGGPQGIGFDFEVVYLRLQFALIAWFFAGVTLAALPWRGLRLLLPGVALIAGAYGFDEPALFFLGLPTVVVALGATRTPALRFLHRIGDPSYGIYIYSFPMQQLLFRYGFATSPGSMFVISGSLSLALGLASWRWLERPSLRAIKGRSWRIPFARAQHA
jgi:peptidoglycan/LPS O-acetylase OafA/YrhL